MGLPQFNLGQTKYNRVCQQLHLVGGRGGDGENSTGRKGSRKKVGEGVGHCGGCLNDLEIPEHEQTKLAFHKPFAVLCRAVRMLASSQGGLDDTTTWAEKEHGEDNAQ